MSPSRYGFAPELHLAELKAVLAELDGDGAISSADLDRAIRRHPKADGSVFSKSELIRGHRWLVASSALDQDTGRFAARLRKKPTRTLSGVATVSVLTQPWPCPGRCVFCPNDVRMPKSYVSSEPGCQRAAQHAFDPYLQTWFRLRALDNIGHRTGKIELIVLGGTWSFYPEAYQVWFIRRCFEAMNEFGTRPDPAAILPDLAPDFTAISAPERETEGGYNRAVQSFLRRQPGGGLPAEVGPPGDGARADWASLEGAHRGNETSAVRCVGLALETRPDHLDEAEVLRLRRLGATKVQI
ncbi:MAG: hypothetical protein KDD11_06830, partial [Acidobacteria bacterium]|nr:hypothetical protein [Acidobacteriota bacterium]